MFPGKVNIFLIYTRGTILLRYLVYKIVKCIGAVCLCKNRNRNFRIQGPNHIGVAQKCICPNLFDSFAKLNLFQFCVQEGLLFDLRNGIRQHHRGNRTEMECQPPNDRHRTWNGNLRIAATVGYQPAKLNCKIAHNLFPNRQPYAILEALFVALDIFG